MKKLFVIGNPIKHSMSPLIHNYWITKYLLNAAYEKKEILVEQLPKIIEDVRLGKIKGLNVTIPFKKLVFELVDIIDDTAKESMAVNTIYRKKGKIIGTNTDGLGFLESLIKDLAIKLKPGANIFCIGAGGAAYGIISQLIKLKPNVVEISNRTEKTAIKLKNHFSDHDKTIIKVRPWGFQPNRHTDLLVNTSTHGMNHSDKLSFNLDLLSKRTFVYDIIYSPRKTELLKKADSLGLKNSNGIYMLIRQAAQSFKKWFDVDLNKEDIINVKKLLG